MGQKDLLPLVPASPRAAALSPQHQFHFLGIISAGSAPAQGPSRREQESPRACGSHRAAPQPLTPSSTVAFPGAGGAAGVLGAAQPRSSSSSAAPAPLAAARSRSHLLLSPAAAALPRTVTALTPS